MRAACMGGCCLAPPIPRGEWYPAAIPPASGGLQLSYLGWPTLGDLHRHPFRIDRPFLPVS